MRTLVESYKRLYQKGRATKEQMKERVVRGLINEAEYKYITGEDYVADEEPTND